VRDVTSQLRDRLRSAHLAARRDRDRRLAGAFASALAALDNAEAVATDVRAGALEDAPGPGGSEAERRELTADDERALVVREIADLRDARAGAADRGDTAEAAELDRLAAALERALP